MTGRRVLEVACGTGYWTVLVARTAAALVATDAVDEPMQIARAKEYGPHSVRFEIADAYALDPALGRFDAAMAIFWWSHVPRSRIGAFLSSLHAPLEPGARRAGARARGAVDARHRGCGGAARDFRRERARQGTPCQPCRAAAGARRRLRAVCRRAGRRARRALGPLRWSRGQPRGARCPQQSALAVRTQG